MTTVMRGMTGDTDFFKLQTEQIAEPYRSKAKQAVFFVDQGDDLMIERYDSVFPGRGLNASAEILFFKVDFQLRICRYAKTTVDHDKYGLKNFVIICMEPDGSDLVFRKGHAFFIIIRRIDSHMIRVLLFAEVMCVGVVVHLPEKVQDMLFGGVLPVTVVDHGLQVFRAQALEGPVIQRLCVFISRAGGVDG